MKKLLTFIVCVVALVSDSGCMMYEPVAGPVYVSPVPIVVIHPYYHYHYGYGYGYGRRW